MKNFFAFIAGLCSISTCLFADTITLGADLWCPYNCDPKSDKPGFLVEIAQEAFKLTDDKLDYRVMEWTQALDDARDGKIDGVIAVTKEEAPGFIFPQFAPASATDSFWTSKKSNWKFNGIDSLKDRLLIIFKGYSYEEPLKTYIAENINNPERIKVLESKTGRDETVNILLSNDKAVLIEESAAMEYFVTSIGKRDQFNEFYSGLPPVNIYIAFSPKNPKSEQYAKILSHELLKMINSGAYQKLVQKYTLEKK